MLPVKEQVWVYLIYSIVKLKNSFKVLFRDLRGRLKLTSSRDISLVEKFSKLLAQISEFLRQVKVQVLVDGFENRLEEVYFFKFEKPEFYALQIYHVGLFGLLQRGPVAVPDLLRAYYLEELPVLDVEFGTAGDYFFAKLMAYEDLRDYILSVLRDLHGASPAAMMYAGKAWFEWSGEVINLVELGYGIWLSGQLGKAGLGEIFSWL